MTPEALWPQKARIVVVPLVGFYPVLQKLLNSEFDKLPVTRQDGSGRKVVGYVMYQDLLRIYDEEIQKLSHHD